MELVRERENAQLTNTELEAQQHNAQISERYKKLQDAMADQFSSEMYEAPREEVRASVATLERGGVLPTYETPVVEQSPEVRDYAPVGIAASVFTAEKFDTLERQTEQAAATVVQPVGDVTATAPTYVAPVIEEKPMAQVEIGTQAQYALTPLAKVVMAVFSVVVVGMLCLIGVNSSIISKKKIKIKNLEKKKEQLIEQHDEIQKRIEAAQSEEAILEWAQSQGMTANG